MKTVQNTLLSAIAATSAMTLFSYIVSKKEGENFKEPRLLGEFVKKSFDTNKRTSQPLGWALHYLTGVGFAGAYKALLKIGKKRPTSQNGLLYGALAAAFGVATWRVLFKTHSNPPKTDQEGFNVQLIAAHPIFGLILSAFKGDKKSQRIGKSL